MTRTQMLREMPADEFVDWQAFHRQYPFGFDWEDLSHARLNQVVESTKPREGKLPALKEFLHQRPNPIRHERLKAEAKARKASKNVRRRT